jgi:CRP-like cAMP-binding protein
MPSTINLEHNYLINALPKPSYEHLFRDLELIEMPLGEVIYEPGSELQYVYFPTTSIVSLFYVTEEGASTEVAVVGNEGMLGIALFMGGENTPYRAIVRSAGYGFRHKAQLLKDEFDRGGPLMHILLRYTQALITQMAQAGVCNRHHSIYQQLCRCLLSSMDRLSSNKVTMTHELIAHILGVRRESVTAAAGRLQNAGLIHNDRGKITVLDRRGLEARACECYQVVKKGFDRLLPYTFAAELSANINAHAPSESLANQPRPSGPRLPAHAL